MKQLIIAFILGLGIPLIGFTQVNVDAFLSSVDQALNSEQAYGYEVEVHSELFSEGTLKSSDIVYRVYVLGNRTFYELDHDGTFSWMDDEHSIKIDPNKKTISIQTAYPVSLLDKLFGELTIDRSRPAKYVEDETEAPRFIFLTDKVDGQAIIYFSNDEALRPVAYEFRSAEHYKTSESFSILKTATVNAIPTKDIDVTVFEQKYIQDFNTNLNPTREYAQYEILNVLF